MRRMVAALGVGALLTTGIVSSALPAFADNAPGANDIVGVGADVNTYSLDFLADGDSLGDPGYNSAGNVNRLWNFDATADANARLTYGPGGENGPCNNGTGGTVGTGHPGTTAGSAPCILNPTIVTRAGTNPVQRPNGSTAGMSAILADTTRPYEINFTRMSRPAKSSEEATAVSEFGGAGLDSVNMGTDELSVLTSSGTYSTNVPGLSRAQLKLIYTCTDRTWNVVGGSSSDSIVPIIPQAGSGTRSVFETDIGITDAQIGSCVRVGEESDPSAIFANWSAGTVAATAASGSNTLTVASGTVNVGDTVTGTGIASGTTVTGVSGSTVTLSAATTAAVTSATFTTNPKDVLEPMAGSRLNLWLGISGTGGSTGGGNYFLDPTNPWAPEASADTSAHQLNPSVALMTGTPSDGGALYQDVRGLYVYFRDSDVNSTTAFQPGGTLNWVRALFYNPCSGTGHTTGCTTIGSNTYGPGGAPFIASSAGQALIAASGVTPGYTVNIGS